MCKKLHADTTVRWGLSMITRVWFNVHRLQFRHSNAVIAETWQPVQFDKNRSWSRLHKIFFLFVSIEEADSQIYIITTKTRFWLLIFNVVLATMWSIWQFELCIKLTCWPFKSCSCNSHPFNKTVKLWHLPQFPWLQAQCL